MSYLDKICARNYEVEFLGDCPETGSVDLGSVIPDDVCPMILHTAAPYYYAFKRGGSFAWTGTEDRVEIQCPNPDGHVQAEVILSNDDGTVSLAVSRVGIGCPMGYEPGAVIDLSSIFDRLCVRVYDVAFPWVHDGRKADIELRCPGCEKSQGITFRLRRKQNESE